MPLTKSKPATPKQDNKNAHSERRHASRDCDTLIQALTDGDEVQRRYAARDLAAFPQSALSIANAIEDEPNITVRQAMFDTLATFDGKLVVDAMVPLLKSEKAPVRNGAIEVLQGFPTEVGPKIAGLLHDPDTDVRIFAIDVLQQLAHPSTPDWLLEVLRDEEHPNVIGTALDRLAEVATPVMRDDLLEIKQRFANQPYICFTADLCLQRLDTE